MTADETLVSRFFTVPDTVEPAAPVPRPLPEEEYERARRLLCHTLQSSSQPEQDEACSSLGLVGSTYAAFRTSEDLSDTARAFYKAAGE